MMADLLQDFVHEAWVHDDDFTTLERVSDSPISDDLRSHRDDLIWWVRWGTDWLYIYLLLEFQSTVEASPENTRHNAKLRIMSPILRESLCALALKPQELNAQPRPFRLGKHFEVAILLRVYQGHHRHTAQCHPGGG